MDLTFKHLPEVTIRGAILWPPLKLSPPPKSELEWQQAAGLRIVDITRQLRALSKLWRVTFDADELSRVDHSGSQEDQQ